MPKPPPRGERRPRSKAKPASRSAATAGAEEGATGERLQKVLASAGFGSRRKCEELIEQGRIDVDGEIVTALGTRVDPQSQDIRVDGQAIKIAKKLYYLVNKPVGHVSTNYDPSGRPRVIDLVPHGEQDHLYAVGRLDRGSEGLMLVTNDGELAQRLTHPSHGVEKTYHALVAGEASKETVEKLMRGVHLAEGVARCVAVRIKTQIKQSTLLEIVLAEGKNREIRRILAKVGHKVMKLRRVAIGPIRLANLLPGHWRLLSRAELESLRTSTSRFDKPRPRKRSPIRVSERPLSKRPSAKSEPIAVVDREVSEAQLAAAHPGSGRPRANQARTTQGLSERSRQRRQGRERHGEQQRSRRKPPRDR